MILDTIARSPSLVEKVCDQLSKIIRHAMCTDNLATGEDMNLTSLKLKCTK